MFKKSVLNVLFMGSMVGFLFVAGNLDAKTLEVGEGCKYKTIQEAVDAVPAVLDESHTIVVNPGIYVSKSEDAVVKITGKKTSSQNRLVLTAKEAGKVKIDAERKKGKIGIWVIDVDYVTIKDFEIVRGEKNPIKIEGSSYVEIMQNQAKGIALRSSPQNPITRDCLIANNFIWRGGILVQGLGGHKGGGSENIKIFNNTLLNGYFYGICIEGKSYNATVKNNIFFKCGHNNKGTSALLMVSTDVLKGLKSDYNCFYNMREDVPKRYTVGLVENMPGIYRITGFKTIAEWQEAVGQDMHSFEKDPLLMIKGCYIGNDDYHLRSAGGRWDGALWIKDTVTSPCVDAGDPNDNYDNEPAPNGGRINMGSFGNTVHASKSVKQ